eukprot:scaffold18957_cov40-Prasinocladus_malaysianus.AAC.1
MFLSRSTSENAVHYCCDADFTMCAVLSSFQSHWCNNPGTIVARCREGQPSVDCLMHSTGLPMREGGGD